LIGNTAVANWSLERQNWTAYYERQLQRQLTQAVAFIRASGQPQQLNAHFDSFLVLMHRARARADLHAAYIELLTALHPWPLRWGRWDAWEMELEQALPVLLAFKQAAKQAELMTYLAEIQFRTGRLETAVHTSRAALILAWENRAVVAWAAAGSRAILALNRLGRNEEARHLLAQLETQLEAADFITDGYERMEASGYLLLRRMIFMRHDGRAAAAAQQAQTLIDQLSALPQTDRRLLATLYTDQATMLWASDQYETAVTALQQAIAIYTALGDTYEVTTTRGNLGLVYWSMARLEEAEDAIRESLHLAETLNARWRMMNEMGNLCAVSFSRGKLEQALYYTERHLALALAADDAAEIDRAHGNRALALLYLGEYMAALPELEESIAQLLALGLQRQLAETYVHLSYCLYGLARRAEAETAVAQAMSLAASIESPVLEAAILHCRALFALPAEATILLQQALALARRYRRRLDEAQCLLRLSGLASGELRQELWAEGAAIMHAIGAEAWLNGRSPDNPPTIAMIL
jgi:tetratricopeptide (TPR) repeat protein